MLTIRDEQMTVFERHALHRFEAWMMSHLTQFFPQLTSDLGGPATEEFIRRGIQRAQAQGFEIERNVCKYIDLMAVFGLDFDSTDWAQKILSSGPTESEDERIEALIVAANEILSPSTI